jgi:hypothetical protein
LTGHGRIGHSLQIPATRADRDSNRSSDEGSRRLAIDPQSAMTPLLLRTRPERPRPGLVPVVPPRRLRALARIVGLITLTTIGVTVVLVVVAGATLFAILNVG